MVDSDYAARIQNQIDTANQVALERLEEIDGIITRIANGTASTHDYIRLHKNGWIEHDSYVAWCETKMEMLREEIERRKL